MKKIISKYFFLFCFVFAILLLPHSFSFNYPGYFNSDGFARAESLDKSLNKSLPTTELKDQVFQYPPEIQLVDEASENPPLVTQADLTPNAKPKTATVAVVIMPLQAGGASWDSVGPGADIVLCGAAGCYISNGLEKPATFYEGSSGLILLKKAGACRDALKCVFRDIDITKLQTDDNKAIQPVDVDYVSHNYMEDIFVTSRGAIRSEAGGLDYGNCGVTNSVITCKTGYHSPNFSLWLMKDEVAQKGGKAGLDFVLFRGILNQRVTAFTDNLFIFRKRVQQSAFHFYTKLFGKDDAVSLSNLKSCVLKAEFLSETFYVLGLADAKDRKAEALLIDLAGRLPRDKLSALIQRTPDFYWAFLDLALQLDDFSHADKYVFKKEQKGVLLTEADEVTTSEPDVPKKHVPAGVEADKDEDINDAKSDEKKQATKKMMELLYGWEVQSRAKGALSLCQSSADNR